VGPRLGRVVQFSGIEARGGQVECGVAGLGRQEQLDLFGGVLGMA
jgi:hypothetical protein